MSFTKFLFELMDTAIHHKLTIGGVVPYILSMCRGLADTKHGSNYFSHVNTVIFQCINNSWWLASFYLAFVSINW